VPKVNLSASHRRALELLSGSADGLTQALLMAHGVAAELIAQLILDGLVGAEAERMMAGGKLIEVRRIRITDAGRRAIQT